VRWKIIDDENALGASRLGNLEVAHIEAGDELAHGRHHIGLLRRDGRSRCYYGDGECDNYFMPIVLLLAS
jgi:hypothetical protein